MTNWKFRVMSKSEKMSDPIQGNFFTTSDVENLTQALVRESIQNSLDARDKNSIKPIKVRFFHSGSKYALPWKSVSKYYDNLIPHLQAESNGIKHRNLPDFSSPMPFLAIEDFETRGLEGDVLESDDPPVGDMLRHNFFWFWRNVGRSQKKDNDRGRWGLGKTVFPGSSVINTYFGLTVRKEDKKKYLMGECVIKIHLDSGGKKRYPYGYFGEYTDSEDEYFVRPVELDESISDFESLFSLDRTVAAGKPESGLSVIIPYPQTEINFQSLIKAVIVQYFYPILSGDLHVEILDGNTDEVVDIRSDTIEETLERVEFNIEEIGKKRSLFSLFELAKYAINIKQDELICLSSPPLSASPIWRKDWFIKNEISDQISLKISSFERGERLAFEIPVKVHLSGQQAKMSKFRVFLEKDFTITESDCHFVRAGITVAGITKPKRKDLRALIVIEDDLLVLLLGDAENPAHTEWQKDSPHFKDKYEDGEKVISFVIAAPGKLYEWLMSPAAGIDKTVLRDIFYIENDELSEDSEETPKNKKGDNSPSKDDIDPKGDSTSFKIGRIEGGFVVSKRGNENQVQQINVKVAYHLPSGNPLKKYRPFDFNLKEMNFTSDGAEVEILEPNEFIITSTGQNFDVAVLGFDTNRDIYIKATAL